MSKTLAILARRPVSTARIQRCCIATISDRARTERHSSLLPETWIISDDNPTTYHSTSSVAHALGLPVATKRVTTPTTIPLFGRLSGLRSLFGESPNGMLSSIEDARVESMPRFAIAASRRALPGLLEIRKRTNGRTMTVYLGLPKTKLSNIDALVLTRLDQMRLRSLGPARANLDNAVSTLLPLSGLSPSVLEPGLRPTVVLCIGSGFEPAGFQLMSNDVDRLAEGLLHLPSSRIRIVLDAEPYRGLRSVVESRLIRRIQERSVDSNGIECPPADIEVIDYAQPGQPPLAELLASATHVIATADNIPVVSMAVSLQRPVYIAGMERTNNLLRDYYYVLDTKNLVRRFYPQGSRYSYMLAPEVCGKVDEFSALRDHEPWAPYDAQQDLENAVAFINERYMELKI